MKILSIKVTYGTVWCVCLTDCHLLFVTIISINIDTANSLRFLQSLPNVELVNETKEYSDLSSTDINSELTSRTHCKYHSVNDIQHLNKPKKSSHLSL